MSSSTYDTPLRLALSPSRWLTIIVLVSHAGALLLIPPLSLPLWGKSVLLAVVVSSLLLILYSRVYLWAKHSIVSLIWDSAGHWQLMTRRGEKLDAHLLPDTYIHPYLVILRFKAPTGRQRWNVTLFPDSLDAETFRRLRVRLKIKS